MLYVGHGMKVHDKLQPSFLKKMLYVIHQWK